MNVNCIFLGTATVNHVAMETGGSYAEARATLLTIGVGTVADLEFHEGGFVRSGALARPRKFLQTTPTSGQKPRPLRS